ncbi:Gfo/Idh/MocA family oxidoreductase [Xanthobacter sp. KR7-225]|uniref:Gfo/Idh/MocA family protein n=1 Tax=Xanthobacter sp. KR7-225 TaxID=3156613 RepID=UPI0032B48566
MTKLRTALVGPGRIALAHLTAIQNNPDLAELVAIVGLPHEAEKTRELATRFRAERVSHDLDEILNDASIDAVVLTVPNHLHCSVGIKALEAGKHVLVEKPLSNTVDEADRMIAAANATGRVLMVAQCRRFFPGAQEAKKRVAELGRPLDIIHILGVDVPQAQADWWKSADATGGLALGLNGPHVIDTILWLLGEKPITVYARTGQLKPQNWQGEDQATVVLSFADGSTATGHLSFNMRPHTNERWIIGPNGSMHLTHDRILKLDGQEVIDSTLTPYIEGDESFDNQFREFALAIREGRVPQASAVEIRPVVEVISAALASARQHAPVDLV